VTSWTLDWDAALAGATVVLALVTAAIAWVAKRTADETARLVASTERATVLDVVIALFREFRELSPERYRLDAALRNYDASRPLSDLDPETRNAAFKVSHFLDALGYLVERELVEVDLIAGFMGGSVINLWEKLGPHIEAERKRRKEAGQDPRYQVYFEGLAKRLQKGDLRSLVH
jgi:hypothetical protein